MIEIVMQIGLTLIVLGAIGYTTYINNKCKTELVTWKEKYRKLEHQKKSSEVRLGKMGEHLAPFLDSWPYDPQHFRFIGSPIDGIQITDDEIIIMEIKTGKARHSESQKKIKELVEQGKVRFETFRIGQEGCSLK